MCGPVFLTSPLLSEPYGFKFTIVILNRRLLRLRRPLIMIFDAHADPPPAKKQKGLTAK